MARCSKKITGSLPRNARRSRPTASSAFEGTATCQPTPCTHATSLVWLCQGSPHLKNPPGMRTTIGAAKRLCVRQRSVPRSEEHTSELQSLRHLVCRLLLEKKKK